MVSSVLVEAENGVGDHLSVFVKKVENQKGYQNADAEAIRQILKSGNETLLYCSGSSGLATEEVLMADVKNKIDSHWRPSDPVEVLTPDPLLAAPVAQQP